MLQGEKSPTLNDLGAQDAGMFAMGKGGFKGECWNCGKTCHRSRDCKEERKGGKGEAPSLGALSYKGKGEGGYGQKAIKGGGQGGYKGSGNGFQCNCYNCGKF